MITDSKMLWCCLQVPGEANKAYAGLHGAAGAPLTPTGTGAGRSIVPMGHNRGERDRPHEVYHPEIEPVSPSGDEPDDDGVSSAFSASAAAGSLSSPARPHHNHMLFAISCDLICTHSPALYCTVQCTQCSAINRRVSCAASL